MRLPAAGESTKGDAKVKNEQEEGNTAVTDEDTKTEQTMQA